jgi:hypothetical protein
MTIKKLVKCFIPYGFLALRRKLKEGMPLSLISLKAGMIENDFQNDYLGNIQITKFSEGGG